MNYFSGEDLIFYKDNNTGKIMSGGYSIDSILLKEGLSPMITLNTDYEQDSLKDSLKGGNKVSNIFENLAIPAGLFYHEQKGGKDAQEPIYFNNTNCIAEDIHDKLFKLIEINNATKKSKTYKNRESNNKNKNKNKSNKVSRKIEIK